MQWQLGRCRMASRVIALQERYFAVLSIFKLQDIMSWQHLMN
jgi:hypothetical protein